MANLSASYHRQILKKAQTFLAWCVKRGWLPSNPLEGVKGIGRINRRKQQLADDLPTWYLKAHELAEQGDQGAVACLLAVLCCLRQSEVTHRKVRDIQRTPNCSACGGLCLPTCTSRWYLNITEGKTLSSVGRVRIPQEIRGYLLKLTEGRDPEEHLFLWRGRGQGERWLNEQTKRICRAAGVPQVCAHSLRGAGATEATDAGVTPEEVARGLRHKASQITKDHYILPEALRAQQQDKLLERLQGPASLVLQQLLALPAEQRLQILAQLSPQKGGDNGQ